MDNFHSLLFPTRNQSAKQNFLSLLANLKKKKTTHGSLCYQTTYKTLKKTLIKRSYPMRAMLFLRIPVPIIKPDRIRSNSFIVLVTVPSVIRVRPVLYLEHRMPKACFTVCCVTGLRIHKTAQKQFLIPSLS